MHERNFSSWAPADVPGAEPTGAALGTAEAPALLSLTPSAWIAGITSMISGSGEIDAAVLRTAQGGYVLGASGA
jgi:hypothetical protein